MKSVTHFLTARNILAVDIHRQSCEKYGSNAMSEGKVQNLVRQFKDGLESVYDKPCSDRPSHNDEEVKSVVKTRFLNQGANYTKMELKLSFELF